MACTCPNIDCIQSTVDDVVICTCTTIITDIVCPSGCTPIIIEGGNAVCECVDEVDPIIQGVRVPVDFDNTNYFTDASWTISFKANEGWNSYFTFYPDYTIALNDFFQVGYNYGEFKETLWSHNLGNQSFQVFQGVLNKFYVEFPILNQNVNKILNTISLDIISKRWQSEWDYSVSPGIGFNKAIIHNNTNNSHLLELVEQRTLSQVKDYPKTHTNSQEILYTSLDDKHTFNSFYNRIKNERNNIPPFLWDYNRIEKTINPQAVSFKGKPILERMRGQEFSVSLINDKESRFQISLNNSINSETWEG